MGRRRFYHYLMTFFAMKAGRYFGRERYRQATVDCFNVMGRGDGAPPAYPSAANGHFVMLNPLPSGKQEINFGGILPDMAQAVTYTLTVE